jgi:hypothetical protein
MAATGVEPPGDDNAVSMDAPETDEGDDMVTGQSEHDTSDDSAYGSDSGQGDRSNQDDEGDPGPPGGHDEGEPAGRRKKRGPTYWQRLRCNPTMHVGLHMVDNIFEYGHLMNPMVLPMELYHSYVLTPCSQPYLVTSLLGQLQKNHGVTVVLRQSLLDRSYETRPLLLSVAPDEC